MDIWRTVTTDSRVSNLIGETQWWVKDVALKKCFGIFNDPSNSLFIIIIRTFHLIVQNTENFNNDATHKATTYLNSLTNFETIITAQLILKIFQNTTPLSKYLKTSGMCILKAKTMIDITLKTLKSASRNFKDIEETALKFVNWANENLEEQNIDFEVQESFCEVRSKTTTKIFVEKSSDHIRVDPAEKFKINDFNLTMDNVTNNLEYRFKNDNDFTADFLYLDPKNFKKITFLPESTFKKLCESLNLFQNEQISINVTNLNEELLDFIKIWSTLRYSSFEETKNEHKKQIEDEMEKSDSEEDEKRSNIGDEQFNEEKNKRCYDCIFWFNIKCTKCLL